MRVSYPLAVQGELMSTITKLIVDVTAKGMEKLKGDSQQFHDNMVKGAAATKKAVMAASAPAKSVAAARQESQDYGVSRSLRPGGTGAGARDFAQEAQGLGGLVRLYATYAANIFAVGAAFRALSNAMDTSNMVKGLDQLGAASGTALGSLSKQLVAATDGAISLREAMEVTAKASSSGMSSENILRMAKVAKQASQALGVDMSDAVSRISRGIVKLEPELLDEIGLFTKTGKAAEDYAKSVGKSATQLTDFERRAAFANAVLAEGEKKFGAIDLQTNPYTQLLASIKDLSQVGLELINKVLGPIVKFFSESPAALATAIAGLAVVLVKQALPALGEFKAGLQATADKATDLSKRKAEDAAAARKQIDSLVIAELYDKEEEKIAIVDAAESKILKLRNEASSAARKLLNDDVNGKATIEEANAVEALSRKRLAAIDNGKVYKTITREQVEADIEAAAAVRERIQVQKQITDTETQLAKNRERDANGITTYGATISAARKAEINATKAQIISNAAYNGSLIGTSDAMVLMREELKKSGLQMGKLETATLSARARMSAFVGQLGTAMNALGVVGMVIGAAVGAFQLLNAAFSTNAKETGDFEKALDRGTSALENLGKTMDFINKKPLLEQISVESINARTTAFKEVADSVSSMTTTLLKADNAASGWDRFMDGFATIWDGDLASKFSKNMSMTIFGSIEKLGSAPEAKEAREKIAEILQIDPTFTKNQLAEILEVTAKTAPEKLKKLETGLQAIGVAAQVSAAKSSELQSAFTKLGDLRKEIEKKTMPTDDLTKYGLEMVNAFTKLSLALEDPKTKLNAIQQLSKELMYVPGAKLSEVMGLQQVAEDAQAAERALAKLDQNRRKIAENRAKLESMGGKEAAAAAIDKGDLQRIRVLVTPKEYELVKDLVNEIKYLNNDSNTQIKIRAELSGKIEAASGQIEAAQLAVFKEGSKFITQGLSAEWAKAGATITNAYASILAGTATGIKMRAAAEQASLTAQVNVIKSQQDLIISNRELALQIQEQLLAEKEREAKRGGSEGAFKEERAQLEKARAGLAAARSGNVKGLYASLSKELESATGPMSQIKLDAIEFARKMEAAAAAVKNTEAQKGAVKIREQVELLQNAQNATNKIAEEEIKSLGIKKQQLEVVKDILGETNSAYIIAKQNIDTQTLEKQQRLELQKIEDKIAQYRMVPNAGAKEEIALLEAEKNRLKALQAGSTEVLKQQQVQEVRTAKYREEQKLATEIFDEAQRQQELSREMISIEETKFELLKSQGAVGENYAITYERILKLKQAEATFDAGVLAAARERDTKLRDVEKNREGLAKFGTPEFAAPGQAEARDRIQKDEAAINAAYQYRISLLGTIRDASLQNANSIAAAAAEQLKWNEALAAAKNLTESLGTVFKELGSALGQTLETMVNFAATSAKNQQDTIAKQKRVNEVKADEWATAEELSSAEKDLANQQKKNTQDELKGITAIAGNAKKMFKEKTAGYKILSAVEKASAAVTAVIEAKKLATTIANVAKQVTALTPAIMGKFFADLGPWGWAAGAAAIAAIGGSFSGGGGTPAGFTAEEVQGAQGTGQDWINGELKDNGGGVLGDLTAKSEDIANSLELIENNTTSQILFDSKAADYLRAIKANTEGLAAALFKAQGITGGRSSFGTVEKSSPGFLGLFAKSTTIIDSGIKAVGNLGEILADPAKYFKQYETVQKTSSGFLGIGGGTKITVNTKPLEVQITEYITGIFQNAKDAIVDLGKVFGLDTTKAVDDLVKTLSVDFQVSAKGLKGDELVEAIMAETGVTMNQLTAQVYPFLEDFQKMGEGMLTTLTRVNTEIQVVDGMFAQIGINFAEKFTPGMDLVNNASVQAAKQATADAKARMDAAKLATESVDDYVDVISYAGDGEVVYKQAVAATAEEQKALTDATLEYNKALQAENNLKYANISASIAVYDSLVESEGGLERFKERLGFFTENFVPASVKLKASVNTVTTGMAELGYAGVNTRDEFYTLVAGLDYSTEAGRNMYNSLMDIAPAFDEVQDAVDSLASSAGISASSLASQITSAFMDGVDGAEIGKTIASTIQRGMYQAMISGVTNSIAEMISNQILTPMLASIVTSGTIVGAVSQATITEVVNKATAMITALGQVLNSPEFQSVIAQLGSLANINFGGISVPEAYKPGPSAEDAAKDAKDAAFKAMDDAFSALKKSVDAQKKLIQEQVKLAEEQIKKIEDLVNILDSNIKELRNSVTETAAMQAAQGKQFIQQALEQALATGVLPDSEQLSEAIGAVRAEIDLGNYDSKFAEDRAKLLLAGQLDQLKALGLDQKTDAELQLEALNKQIEDLDKLVEAYQLQIDAIKGVDNSVKSVADAIKALESAMAGAMGTGGSGGGGGGGFVSGPGGSNTGKPIVANRGFSDGITKDYLGVYNSGTVSSENGVYTYSSGVTDASGFSSGPTQVDTLTSNKAWTTTGYAANNKDVVDYYYANKSTIESLGQATNLADYLLFHFITYGISEKRKFAKGGIFDNSIVTAPTLFNASLMGEAGPEAIMPLGKMPDGSLGVRGTSGDNAELIAEIRNLKAELTHMKQYVAKTSTSTEESRKLLDEVVRGGEAITVTSEIATY